MLAIMLLAMHQALLRDASTIAGVCIPAIIMISYIIWILYSAHRDRRKVKVFFLIEQWPLRSRTSSPFLLPGPVPVDSLNVFNILEYWDKVFRARNFFPSLYSKIFRYFVNFIDKIFDGIGMAISRKKIFSISLVFFLLFCRN